MHKILVGNYKNFGNSEFYFQIQEKLKDLDIKDTKLILCPNFLFLNCLKIETKNVYLCVQDMDNLTDDSLCQYALVGHWDKRKHGETNETIVKKVTRATDKNIIPIICVGEQNKDNSHQEITQQVEYILKNVGNSKFFFAYEPVWSVGTDKFPSKKHVLENINLIKSMCTNFGKTCQVLYGGNLNENNLHKLLHEDIDGFMFGRMCLDIEKFFNLVLEIENE